MRTQLEGRLRHRLWNDGDVRTAFGVGFASESFAMPAVDAGAQTRAVRVRVGARCVCARARKRVVAHLRGRVVEERLRVARLERWQRIVAVARLLEEVAPGLLGAFHVARFTANARRPLELV